MKNMPIPYKITLSIIIFIWLVLIIRVGIITIQWGSYYDNVAQNNALKEEIIVPVRGNIKDRNGKPLAINEIFFNISIKPNLKKEQLQKAALDITEAMPEFSLEDIIQTYKNQSSAYNHNNIKVIDFINYDAIFPIFPILKHNKNLQIAPTFRRKYPHNSLASHVIGYVGAVDKQDEFNDPTSRYTKIKGKEGIEKEYNAFLQGKLGYKTSIVNAYNQKLQTLNDSHDYDARHDLFLTLDYRLQKKADELFADKNGAMVVMDIKNGEILVAGSYPEYDLNDFIGGISSEKWNALRDDVHKPLINRFANGQYPPGSIVKMGMVLSILEYGNIDERTIIQTPYSIKVGNWQFRDWKYGGHGSADAFKAIRESVDVYFYKMAQVVGIDKMTQVLGTMGFGEKTGLDFPNESSGILPTPKFKAQRYGQNWFIGDTIQTSIGQGLFLATPMQVARYTALLGSSTLPTPHFLKSKNNVEPKFEAKDVLNDFEKSKLWVTKRGMIEVCNAPGGTAVNRVWGARVKMACKTGTAQVVSIPQDVKKRLKESEMDYFSRSHSWFSGFVPADNPKYAFSILIEHGASGGNGAPLAVEMVNLMKDLGYFD